MITNKTQEELFEIIKGYTDVCRESRIEPVQERDFAFLGPNGKRNYYFQMLQDIAALFNGDWKPDYSDGSQYKWYPYFIYKKGLGLVFHGSRGYFDSYGGQVVLFKNKEISDFVGRTFPEIYIALSE